ncbi:MAG: glycosyltransferase family 39 protein [Burkholderiales bacterium]|nr:glycosyltransferase family 39 protein [Burkholderiales bacterium]
MSVTRSRSNWLWPLLMFVWLLCTAGWRPLAVPDEGRYAGVAWEMIRSGDWLTPTLNGLPFFHKPPLFYWLTASSLSVFGLNLVAARMASVLGAWLGAWALYGFAQRWAGAARARWATVALLTQPFYFGGAQYANLDMLVAGCITATIALAAHAVLLAEKGLPHRASLWGAYALAGLGLLAKGLIGLVLPGAVLVLWLLLSGRWRRVLWLISVPGLILFALVAAPWFVLMQRLYPDFFHYFFVYQHFQRFTQTGFNNAHPIWFYVPLIMALTLPWWPVWIWSKRGQQPTTAPVASEQPAGLNLLMWVWLVVIVGFFSLPASKLPGYVLPALPPLAYLMADGALRRSAGRWWEGGRAILVTAIVSALACVALIGAAVRYDQQSTRPMVPIVQPLLQQGVPLLYVDEFAYDLPFYLGLRQPLPMVADWQSPDLPLHDNDQKELFDAGEFNQPLAAQLLIRPDQWHVWLCRAPRLMVVASDEAERDYPELAWQAPQVVVKRKRLWVLDRATLINHGLICP